MSAEVPWAVRDSLFSSLVWYLTVPRGRAYLLLKRAKENKFVLKLLASLVLPVPPARAIPFISCMCATETAPPLSTFLGYLAFLCEVPPERGVTHYSVQGELTRSRWRQSNGTDSQLGNKHALGSVITNTMLQTWNGSESRSEFSLQQNSSCNCVWWWTLTRLTKGITLQYIKIRK